MPILMLLQRVRDLTIAVELVAEDVGDDDDLRVDIFADRLERRLVRFDQCVGDICICRPRVECMANSAVTPLSRFAPDLLAK